MQGLLYFFKTNQIIKVDDENYFHMELHFFVCKKKCGQVHENEYIYLTMMYLLHSQVLLILPSVHEWGHSFLVNLHFLQCFGGIFTHLGSLTPNRYESDLSNEVLYILVSQEAAKILEVKVRGRKENCQRGQPRTR